MMTMRKRKRSAVDDRTIKRIALTSKAVTTSASAADKKHAAGAGKIKAVAIPFAANPSFLTLNAFPGNETKLFVKAAEPKTREG